MLVIIDPDSRAAKKSKNHGNEVLPQDNMHLIQRPFTYEEAPAKIQHAIGLHKDVLITIKRCKLEWYGLVSCSSALVKVILQGTVKGGRRQGRQKKEVGRHHLGF